MELLSPAGTLEKLKVAVNFGADAVYAGVKKFSLRERAGNFTIEELKEGIDYAHSKGKKVYVTLNAFLKNHEIENFKKTVDAVAKLNPDGFIVADIGALSIIKDRTDIPIHISTQANVTNIVTVKAYKNLGASRIVLARELSLKEIAEIKKAVSNMEIEVFVHGAMCMAYSGRCLLSNYLTKRDPNRGSCAQSCRWKYYVVEEKREGELYPIEEDHHGTYIFNSKDLCALPLLDKLYEIGVNSVKIEGRVKSVYYVAVTTAIYRRAIDLIKNNPESFKTELPKLLEELDKVSHRPYTTGFLQQEKELQYYPTSSYIRKYKFLAIYKNNFWKVKNPFNIGDKVELFSKDGKSIKATIKKIVKNGEKQIHTAHTNYNVDIEFIPHLKPENYDIIRKEIT
ncbi:U32 family peptidase C-terminal domain-containing protein [Desulfurobacterium indicum]|uniref:Peptidase U32 n=1 Tax=Desulfurobacterium indicum TaxID=1914305 RepID=A0A1R1MLY7_9BACT|nr:U32 family peptidase C-terminal domain-containing protein [Desulfurobacterium indicum]OMH40821.1 peptidase U32 [Desulfurobacterium indicum]